MGEELDLFSANYDAIERLPCDGRREDLARAAMEFEQATRRLRLAAPEAAALLSDHALVAARVWAAARDRYVALCVAESIDPFPVLSLRLADRAPSCVVDAAEFGHNLALARAALQYGLARLAESGLLTLASRRRDRELASALAQALGAVDRLQALAAGEVVP
jgi:hypothetical protein